MLQLKTYSPVPNNKGVLIKGRAEWGPADDLNINKRRGGVRIKGGGESEKGSQSKVATCY